MVFTERVLRDLHFHRLARSGRPILIGPWRSEVGFESLYWLPWLAAWRAKYQIAKERLIVVSRGGAGVWYDVAKAVDLYDYVPMEKLRKAMLADSLISGSIKQQQMTTGERKLLPVIAHDLGLRRYHVLHPSLMYRQLAPWWEGTMGTSALQSLLAFTPIPVPAPPLSLPLPERYVAVGFYARHTWPLTEDLRMWVANLVDGIAVHLPVVLLDTGLHTDDHVPFPLVGERLISLKGQVTPHDNLAVQSAVIAKAQAFVGTYGGTMQLAVRLKKPSVGFYRQFGGTAYNHKVLTEHLGVLQGTPVFIGRPDDARMVREVMQI